MSNLINLIDAILDAYDRTDFKPNPDGSTHCNQAVQAIAANAYGYLAFAGMNADQMVQFLEGAKDWQEVDMAAVQAMANNGSLVVAGLASTDLKQQHGHIVVIRPGLQCESGKWGNVPRCCNIGGSDFIARSQTGVLTNQPVGVNEAFIPTPKFWVLRSSL